MNKKADDIIVEPQFTLDRISRMFSEINNNDKEILSKIHLLTETVKKLDEDVKSLKKEVFDHHDQLLIMTKSIEFTLKYGAKLIGIIAFLTLTYETIKKVLPH